MRKKAEITAERTAAAVERNPNKLTGLSEGKRVSGPLPKNTRKERGPGVVPGNGGLPAPGPDEQMTARSPEAKKARRKAAVQDNVPMGKAIAKDRKDLARLEASRQEPTGAGKARGKKAAASQEPEFQIITGIPGEPGCKDYSGWMSKGELLAFLAEEVSNEPLQARQGKSVPFKMPKEFGAIADLLYTTRKDRLEFQHRADALKVHETAMKDYLINNLSKKDSTGAAGKVARAQIVTETQPIVEDWDGFYKYIARTKSFDLLNRAVNRKAVGARWDAGKEIPGVGRFDAIKVSVTKVGR